MPPKQREQPGIQVAVFDDRRGNTEGSEADKLLAFWPSDTPDREQAAAVGLVQAMAAFMANFCGVRTDRGPVPKDFTAARAGMLLPIAATMSSLLQICPSPLGTDSTQRSVAPAFWNAAKVLRAPLMQELRSLDSLDGQQRKWVTHSCEPHIWAVLVWNLTSLACC